MVGIPSSRRYERRIGRGLTSDILCGHHMRAHVPAMLAKAPASYWIEPQELVSIRGVNVEAASTAKAGDGLTDPSR